MILQDNLDRAIQVGTTLISAYNGKGVFGHRTGDMPELLKPKNMEEKSIQHVNYITLLVALDYMREANQLWQAGVNTFEDEETRWVFDVNSLKIDDLDLLMETLKKHKVSKKYERDAKIWQTIAKSIRELFDGNMKKFLEEDSKNEAGHIYSFMKSFYKKEFPNLTGDKILPLWIRMMKDVCGVEFKNINKIPIPVDVHIARATIFSGCLGGNNVKTSIPKIMPDIDRIWTEVAERTDDFNKFDLDEPLWTLSKYGCKKLNNKDCPVFDECPIKEFCEAVKRTMKVVQGEGGVVIE
ncbi:N-glycosylase/DNA lyase [Candidatus Woesearchaeota archaeon]|nr:N-glycosylase/DNA lyase [Candidatus Woesearchaeota archaeon]